MKKINPYKEIHKHIEDINLSNDTFSNGNISASLAQLLNLDRLEEIEAMSRATGADKYATLLVYILTNRNGFIEIPDSHLTVGFFHSIVNLIQGFGFSIVDKEGNILTKNSMFTEIFGEMEKVEFSNEFLDDCSQKAENGVQFYSVGNSFPYMILGENILAGHVQRMQILSSRLDLFETGSDNEDIDSLLGNIADILGEYIPIDRISFSKLENNGSSQNLRVMNIKSNSEEIFIREGSLGHVTPGGKIDKALSSGDMFYVNDIKSWADLRPSVPRFTKYILKEGFNSSLFIPILNAQGVALGIMFINSKEKKAYSDESVELVKQNFSKLSGLFNKLVYKEQLEQATRFDELTKVETRRQLNNTRKELTDQFVEAFIEGENQNLWFLFMDLDNFKFYNENYGHLIGDEVLKSIASSIKSSLRGNDQVFRYGGEEFVAIIKDFEAKMSQKEIVGIMKRVQDSINSTVVLCGEDTGSELEFGENTNIEQITDFSGSLGAIGLTTKSNDENYKEHFSNIKHEIIELSKKYNIGEFSTYKGLVGNLITYLSTLDVSGEDHPISVHLNRLKEIKGEISGLTKTVYKNIELAINKADAAECNSKNQGKKCYTRLGENNYSVIDPSLGLSKEQLDDISSEFILEKDDSVVVESRIERDQNDLRTFIVKTLGTYIDESGGIVNGPIDKLKDVIGSIEFQSVSIGTKLVEKSKGNNLVYILLDGELEVKDGLIQIDMITKNKDMFGYKSILTGKKPDYTVVAKEESRVACIPKDVFLNIFKNEQGIYNHEFVDHVLGLSCRTYKL